MKNVVITGANSFIALHLIDTLLMYDYNIYAVVRRDANKKKLLPKSQKIKIIEADMNEYESLDKLVDVTCDYFFSFAWNGTRGEDRNNIDLQESNYEYSVDAIKSMIRIGCRTVVLAGSQAEYGLGNSIITENMECNPITQYGKMKLKLFNYMKEFCMIRGVKLLEPRFFSLYGPLDYEGTLVMSVLKDMLDNRDCELTEGTQLWDYLHVKDASIALVKLLESNCDSGSYNFGSGDSRIIKEYIEEMKSITNSKSRLLFGKIEYPSTGVVSVEPDISKLKKSIDWSPSIDFRAGIVDLMESFRNGL